jgi:tripartite-type tricarboxylate transporter receptor subunit TctC
MIPAEGNWFSYCSKAASAENSKNASDIEVVEKPLPKGEYILITGSAEFPEGVIGLIASKIQEDAYRPAIAMTYKDGEMRGSARSIPEFNIVAALDECADLLVRHGGHAAAAALYEQLPFRPINDFTFVSLVTQIPFLVATYPEHPVKTVPELIAAAKSSPEPIIYATSGAGTGQHLSAELFAAMANVKLKHLPSKGGTAVPTMLLGKHIELGFEPPPTLLELLKDGKLRAIATTGPTRFFALPNVPTIGETIPGYEVTSYFGLAGPANLPADVVKRLNAATVAMVKEPKTVERLRVLGSAPISSTPQGFKERVAADITRWTKLVTDVGIKRFDAQQ